MGLIDIKSPKPPQTGFCCSGWGGVVRDRCYYFAVAFGYASAMGLCLHNHVPMQLAIGFAFHHLAADEVGGNDFFRAIEERFR